MNARLWAISDLHLAPQWGSPAPAEFNRAWADHPWRLFRFWKGLIGEDDVVLLPGDILDGSGSSAVPAALSRLDSLPGRKIVGPGNHDPEGLWTERDPYRLRKTSILPLSAGQAERISFDERTAVIVAAMGALAPDDPFFPSRSEPGDYRFARGKFQRELGRLRASLSAGNAMRQPAEPLILLFHYAPWQGTVWATVIERAGVDLCLYGHLHWPDEWREAPNGRCGRYGPTYYRLVAADSLDMRPLEIGALFPARDGRSNGTQAS